MERNARELKSIKHLATVVPSDHFRLQTLGTNDEMVGLQ